MGKGLWLGLRSGRSSQGGLSLGRSGGRGEKLDLLADGAAEVGEGLIDVSRVVIGFGRVLVADVGQIIVRKSCFDFEKPAVIDVLTSQPASSGGQP